jgi:hypothetical protein
MNILGHYFSSKYKLDALETAIKKVKVFNIFGLITTYNFVKIYIITPNYAH